jgi:hypothetical protein
MTSNIVIKKENDTKKISLNRSDSFYSLIDKPYYIEAMYYKVDK